MTEDKKIVTPFGAAPKCETRDDFHDGTLVSIAGERLVMASTEGHLYSFMVAPDTNVCCNGTTCRAEDLKVGSKIRLTTKAEDKNAVTRIEALDTQAQFAGPH